MYSDFPFNNPSLVIPISNIFVGSGSAISHPSSSSTLGVIMLIFSVRLLSMRASATSCIAFIPGASLSAQRITSLSINASKLV